MTSSLASFNTIMTNRSIDVATTVGALVRNMDRYVAISPPLLREQVVYVPLTSSSTSWGSSAATATTSRAARCARP